LGVVRDAPLAPASSSVASVEHERSHRRAPESSLASTGSDGIQKIAAEGIEVTLGTELVDGRCGAVALYGPSVRARARIVDPERFEIGDGQQWGGRDDVDGLIHGQVIEYRDVCAPGVGPGERCRKRNVGASVVGRLERCD